MNDNQQMTDEELDHLCKYVLPAIRRDGVYFKDEDKLIRGEITPEEFITVTVQRFKEQHPNHTGLLDKLVGELV